MKGLLADLKMWRFWRHFLTRAFATGGALAAALQFFALIYPKQQIFAGHTALIVVATISVIAGLVLSWPRPIKEQYSTPNTLIRIVSGDLLDQESHLVIGTCDTFDTEPPVIISKASLQGQALDRLFGGDVKELDRLLDERLKDIPVIETVKKKGKTQRYPLGTVVTVKHGARLLFFVAYTSMNEANEAHGTIDGIWKSLGQLWERVSAHGNGQPLSIAVVGGGQSRLSSILPTQDAIRIILLSFMFASRRQRICEELRVVVNHTTFERLDRLELQSFLSSLRPS